MSKKYGEQLSSYSPLLPVMMAVIVKSLLWPNMTRCIMVGGVV